MAGVDDQHQAVDARVPPQQFLDPLAQGDTVLGIDQFRAGGVGSDEVEVLALLVAVAEEVYKQRRLIPARAGHGLIERGHHRRPGGRLTGEKFPAVRKRWLACPVLAVEDHRARVRDHLGDEIEPAEAVVLHPDQQRTPLTHGIFLPYGP